MFKTTNQSPVLIWESWGLSKHQQPGHAGPSGTSGSKCFSCVKNASPDEGLWNKSHYNPVCVHLIIYLFIHLFMLDFRRNSKLA